MDNFKNIADFAKFLWGESISEAQIALLKTLYGQDLSTSERSFWRKYSEKQIFARYKPQVYSEALCLLGRQSGKSSRIGTTCALFEALCVERAIPAGERLAVLFFAPTIRQSTFDQVSEKLRATPELAELIENDASASGEIRLNNGIDLVSYSSNPRHARGRASILCLVDEAAFVRVDSSFECNLPELLESVRPSLIVHSGKLLLLSSPSGKEGPLFTAWEHRDENPDVLVWRAPSQAMNPAIDPKLLEREKRRGENYFRREYLAEFVESANPFLNLEALEAAILHGTTELPPNASDSPVFAGVDLADKVDSCALGISTVREIGGKRKVVLLFAKEWKPSRSGHDVLAVLREMGEICKRYHVTRATGDQKSMSVAENVLAQYNVSFQRVISAGAGSEQTYRTFSALLNDHSVALIAHPTVIEQARRLEEKIGDGNRFLVQGRRGSHDDLIVAAILSVSMCAEHLNVHTPIAEAIYEWSSADPEEKFWLRQECRERERIPSFARNRY